MSGRVFLHTKSQIGSTTDLYLAMGAQSLRAGQSIVLGPGVLMLIALAFAHLTRELLSGLN